MVPTGTPQPHTSGPAPEGLQPTTPTDEPSAGERLLEQLPSALVGLIEDGDLAKFLQQVQGLPAVTFAFPMDDPLAPFLKTIDSDYAVRAVGRALGEPLLSPLALVGGWALTLYPEFSENVDNGAPAAEFLADGMVDSVGFGVGELAGWVVGLGTAPEIGPAAIGAKLGADVVVGAAYDAAADGLGVRQWLTARLQGERDPVVAVSTQSPGFEPQQAPTAPAQAPTSTPSPPETDTTNASSTLGGEYNSAGNAVEITPIVTQTPSPPDSD